MELDIYQQLIARSFKNTVAEVGEAEARKLWGPATDPVTGYVSRIRNACHLLNNEFPCRRCGGYGRVRPGGYLDELKPDHVLCVRCWDDWDDTAVRFLEKHGYIRSPRKWNAAWEDFCKTKPVGVK